MSKLSSTISVDTWLFSGVGSCHHPYEDVTISTFVFDNRFVRLNENE